MDSLIDKKLIDNNSLSNFAKNRIVLITPNNANIEITNFSDLQKVNINKIAIGNPKTVPAGFYAIEILEKLNLKLNIEQKFIYGEHVRQVLDYVERGEVDAGIVYLSDAKQSGKSIKIASIAEENLHTEILYPIAVLSDSKKKEIALKFIQFVKSEKGVKIMNQNGFTGILQ